MNRAYLDRLPAYLLGLLEGPEQERLEQSLEQDADLRRELELLRALALDWSADDAVHPSDQELSEAFAGAGDPPPILGHLLDCEDCRFAAALLREAEAVPRPARTDAPPDRPNRWLPPLMALAAVAVMAFALGVLVPFARPELPGAAHTLDLRTQRGASEQLSLRISELDADTLALVLETRLPAGRSDWGLTHAGDRLVAGGTLEFGPDSPELRHLTLIVPVDRLAPSGMYVLRIRSADGSIERVWFFTVQP